MTGQGVGEGCHGWLWRSVSECRLSLPQGEGHTPVVLGEPGDAEAVLGVVTLEILVAPLDCSPQVRLG